MRIITREYLQIAIISRMQSLHRTPQLRLWTLLLLLAPAISEADGVDWPIAPYGWLPDISIDIDGELDLSVIELGALKERSSCWPASDCALLDHLVCSLVTAMQ